MGKKNIMPLFEAYGSLYAAYLFRKYERVFRLRGLDLAENKLNIYRIQYFPQILD